MRTSTGGRAEARARLQVAVKYLEAAKLLRQVDVELAKELAKLIRLKPPAHYGHAFISEVDRTISLRAARKLVSAAQTR